MERRGGEERRGKESRREEKRGDERRVVYDVTPAMPQGHTHLIVGA